QIINGDWSGAWQTLNTTMQSIMDRATRSVLNIVELFKAGIVNKMTQLRDGAIARVTSLQSSITSKFKAIGDRIVSPILMARDKIRNAIDRIKGFFSGMSLKFPSITMPKLPRFSLSGS